MPQDLVVRESRGLHIFLALFGVGMLIPLLPSAFEALADGVQRAGIFSCLLSQRCLCVAYLFVLRLLGSEKLCLWHSRTGCFFPQIHPEVIPWIYVESVRLSHIGQGTSVLVVLSDEFETRINLPWIVRLLAWIGQRIGLRGWLLNGLHDRSKQAIVHVVDDWIRYETRQAPKPRYRPGIADALLRFLDGIR